MRGQIGEMRLWVLMVILTGSALAASKTDHEEHRGCVEEQGARIEGAPTAARSIVDCNVVSVCVQPGETVQPGQRLLVVEFMKLEMELRADIADGAAVIKCVHVQKGQDVHAGQLVIEYQSGHDPQQNNDADG
jgi:biotin carboxyl carrier protein